MEASVHPIRLSVQAPLVRSRLTVFFRLPLAVVHLLWLVLWSVVVVPVAVVGWLITLLSGRLPEPLHRFLTAYLRYGTHLSAFLLLVANPFPGFVGAQGSYPIDVHVAGPARQNRWKTLFRLPLAIPATMLAATLANGSFSVIGGYFSLSLSLLTAVALLGWFVALARGALPAGYRDAGALGLAYAAQQLAYVLLLTDRYPDCDPESLIEAERPTDRWAELEHLADAGRRGRLGVFFRAPLVLPHVVWLVIWGLLVYVVVLLNWFALLVQARSPDAFHRLICAYLRYQLHVSAYLLLTAERYPSFIPSPQERYAVDVRFGEPQAQSRVKTLLRLVLALPAMLLAGAYANVMYTAALLGWFVALFTGRMPRGLGALQVACLNYITQLYAYYLLVTDQYPHTGPVVPRPVSPSGPAPVGA